MRLVYYRSWVESGHGGRGSACGRQASHESAPIYYFEYLRDACRSRLVSLAGFRISRTHESDRPTTDSRGGDFEICLRGCIVAVCRYVADFARRPAVHNLLVASLDCDRSFLGIFHRAVFYFEVTREA